MDKEIILAFDPGTKLGWATNYKGFYTSGMEWFKAKDDQSLGVRLRLYRRFVKKLLDKYNPVIVICEQMFFSPKRGAGNKLTISMDTIIQELVVDIELATVHPATLKKYITGNGKASKEDMVKEANLWMIKLGRQPNIIDNNRADAINLLRWGEENLL